MNDVLLMLTAFVILGFNYRRLGRYTYAVMGVIIVLYMYRAYNS